MAAPAPTFDSIIKALKGGDVPPVMVFHGQEGYFIDKLVEAVEGLVPEEDRDLALNILFAPITAAEAVCDVCRRIPMMTERQVVIVKEAQAVPAKWVDKLAAYVASPSPYTVLAIIGRGDKIKGSATLKAAKATGVVYEAAPVRDYLVPRYLTEYIKSKGMAVDPKAAQMLQDFIGANLGKLYNEVDKLAQILGAGAMITPEAVERNVGVSREFNTYELVDALAVKDAARAFRIAAAFEANPKAHATMMTLPPVFNFFADLLIAYYAADPSDRGIREELHLTNDFALRRIRSGMSNYSARQVIDVLHAIRRFDAMSKGSGSRQDQFRLFHDLVYHILTAPGTLPA